MELNIKLNTETDSPELVKDILKLLAGVSGEPEKAASVKKIQPKKTPAEKPAKAAKAPSEKKTEPSADLEQAFRLVDVQTKIKNVMKEADDKIATRDKIKAELVKHGAKNATSLAPEKFAQVMEFLNGLG